MKINSPCMITSRLCAGVKIGDVTISIEYSDREGDNGHIRFRYYLDSADGENEYTSDDLQSGCGGGNLQEGLESLLAFLGHAGEAYRYDMATEKDTDWEPSDGTYLFPAWVNEWAYQNDDEIGILRCEMENGETVLIDEG